MRTNDNTEPCPTCSMAVNASAIKLLARAERAEARIAEQDAAMLRNDERHAEEMRSVRQRAERAEAEVTRLRDVLESIADGACETPFAADCCNEECKLVALQGMAEGPLEAVRERDGLLARIAELEADNARLREALAVCGRAGCPTAAERSTGR